MKSNLLEIDKYTPNEYVEYSRAGKGGPGDMTPGPEAQLMRSLLPVHPR